MSSPNQAKTKSVVTTVVSTVVFAVIQAMLPILIALMIGTILVSAFKWLIDKAATAVAGDAMQGYSVNLTKYIDIDENNNLVFIEDEDGKTLKDVVLQEINNSGVSSSEMGLTEDNLIEDMINAEIVTSYPYLGGDGLQGIVNFYRRD